VLQNLRMNFSSLLQYFDDAESILACIARVDLRHSADYRLCCKVFCGDQSSLAAQHLAADCRKPLVCPLLDCYSHRKFENLFNLVVRTSLMPQDMVRVMVHYIPFRTMV